MSYNWPVVIDLARHPKRGRKLAKDETSQMKRLCLLTLPLIVLCALQGTVSRASENGRSVHLIGWIVDDTCGGVNANAEGRACTLKCHKDGARLVLFEEKTERLYPLDPQAQAKQHIGRVEIEGRLVDGRIEIITIVPRPEESAES